VRAPDAFPAFHLPEHRAHQAMSRTRKPQQDSFFVGLRTLEYLVSSRSSKGVSQIAAGLGIPVSSAHDILRLLVRLGFVEQKAGTHRYEATTGMFRLINRFATEFGIIPHVHEAFRECTRTLHATIYLCRFWEGETYVIYAQGEVASTASLGGHHPAHFSAAAKAILGRRTREDWEKFAPARGKREWFRELEVIQKEGVAWNLQKTDPNICSVAISLGERDDLSDYAVALVFRPEEFRKWHRSVLVETLRETRARIELRIPRL
jgi:DNA-binding IclR family transcriptional regulator